MLVELSNGAQLGWSTVPGLTAILGEGVTCHSQADKTFGQTSRYLDEGEIEHKNESRQKSPKISPYKRCLGEGAGNSKPRGGREQGRLGRLPLNQLQPASQVNKKFFAICDPAFQQLMLH